MQGETRAACSQIYHQDPLYLHASARMLASSPSTCTTVLARSSQYVYNHEYVHVVRFSSSPIYQYSCIVVLHSSQDLYSYSCTAYTAVQLYIQITTSQYSSTAMSTAVLASSYSCSRRSSQMQTAVYGTSISCSSLQLQYGSYYMYLHVQRCRCRSYYSYVYVDCTSVPASHASARMLQSVMNYIYVQS